MARDLHHNIKVVCAIAPQVCGTSGIAGGVLSNALDRAGYEAVEVALNYGTTASVADTITPIVYESDASTGGFTSVANADLLGTEAGSSLPAATRTSGSGKNVAHQIGYIGIKRYLKLRMYGLGTATGTIGATWLLGHARNAPIAT
jgi:hypothetical protein